MHMGCTAVLSCAVSGPAAQLFTAWFGSPNHDWRGPTVPQRARQVVSKASGVQARRRCTTVEVLQRLLGDGASADGALALKDVNELLQLLWERKQVLQQPVAIPHTPSLE